jgi:hypothetical protein
MVTSQHIVPELGLNDTNPQGTRMMDSATDAKEMKQPLKRPKSKARRKLPQPRLKRMI